MQTKLLMATAVATLLLPVITAGQEDEGEPMETFVDKTLVAWVTPANLEQQGGGVLSIGGTSQHFDAIVFGEIAPRRWMAGSNFYDRTHREQEAWPEETAAPGALVQVAIVYEGRRVALYRNGETHADYEMASDPVSFAPGDLVVMGLRHLGAANGYFAGAIEDARIYDQALDANALASLEPNRPTGPEPVGWWDFEGDSHADRMGNFPEGELFGGAEVRDGKLHVDGVSACLVVRKPLKVAREEGGWPIYHITALPDEGVCLPYDANGCIYWEGKYHLMYIFQRADGGHCWGHASSPDLIQWTFHPTALAPGPGDPDRGIFSGNAYVNKDGEPMLCWFGIDAGVCVATAADDDLIVWEKHPSNPIVPVPKEGESGHGVYTVWDPYLWLEGDTYMCLLGGNRLPNGRDTLYLCTSPDLVNWTARHAFYEGDPTWRREDEDCSCPDFFPVGDRHVLMCISHAIGARFYVGSFDAAAGKFEPESHVRMNWPGGMFFAPESLEAPDGRRIFWAWVTDPRIGSAQQPTGSGFQSLPRVLDFADDGTPLITPAKELERLRDDRTTHPDVVFDEDEEVVLEDIRGAHMELSLEIDTSDAEAVGVKVRCAPDGSEETAIWYVPGDDVLRIDVSRSTLRDDVVYGSPPFTSYGIQAVGPEQASIQAVDAPLELPRGGTLRLRIFVDGPMLEVFANDRQCLTQVIYPKSRDADMVKLCARGGPARATAIEAWEMEPLAIIDERDN